MKPIMIIGEAWGRQEEEKKQPFVGPSGQFLRGALRQVGIPESICYFTNVFNLRPQPTNDVSNLCGTRSTSGRYPYRLAPGKYIMSKYDNEIDRLFEEIRLINPNLIIALGNTPLTVLSGASSSISRARGTITVLPSLRRADASFYKVLPTYHPAAVLREFSLRPIVIADLAKAARNYQSAEYVRPSRRIFIEPSLNALEAFFQEHIAPQSGEPWGVDIETQAGTITEIGFARPTVGIVVPFYSRAAPSGNYWPTAKDERVAWEWVRQTLHTLKKPIFQNGLYDLNYLWRMGITVPGAGHDTMLLAHALQPELKKGLGFLGSVYTDEPSWKFMRKDNKTLKKEDE